MKTRRWSVAVATLCLAVLLCPFAQASGVTFLSRPPVDDQVCSISDAGYSFVFSGTTIIGQETAASFVAPYDVSMIGLRWWGSYGHPPDPCTDAFLLRLFADAGGVPASSPLAVLSVTDIARSLTDLTATPFGDHDGGDVYAYVADLDPWVSLTSGTTYYLSIYNDTDSRWGWLLDGSGTHWFRNEEPAFAHVWRASSRLDSPAFELVTTPEPSSLALFAVGGAAVAIYRRRRR